MVLNILSDLHLSLDELNLPDTAADLVILAGDVGRPKAATSWAFGFAKPVLYVPGNHEFYGDSIAGTLAGLKRLCAGTNVRVLDGDEVIVDGVRFLGTTLWTDFMIVIARMVRRDRMEAAYLNPANSVAGGNVDARGIEVRIASGRLHQFNFHRGGHRSRSSVKRCRTGDARHQETLGGAPGNRYRPDPHRSDVQFRLGDCVYCICDLTWAGLISHWTM